MKVLPTTAYCMNLDGRTDRWEQVSKDFTRLSQVMPISIERVSAVENKIRPQEGVAQTVHKILGIAKEKGLPYVLILEDDLFVIDPTKVERCLNNAPDDWDILSGGAYYYKPSVSFSGEWMKMKDFCSMHFIIIRDTIYNKVLEMDGRSHLDRMLGSQVRSGAMTMYLMYPMPCQQRPGFSNIRKRAVDDNLRKLPWVDHPDTIRGAAISKSSAKPKRT